MYQLVTLSSEEFSSDNNDVTNNSTMFDSFANITESFEPVIESWSFNSMKTGVTPITASPNGIRRSEEVDDVLSSDFKPNERKQHNRSFASSLSREELSILSKVFLKNTHQELSSETIVNGNTKAFDVDPNYDRLLANYLDDTDSYSISIDRSRTGNGIHADSKDGIFDLDDFLADQESTSFMAEDRENVFDIDEDLEWNFNALNKNRVRLYTISEDEEYDRDYDEFISESSFSDDNPNANYTNAIDNDEMNNSTETNNLENDSVNKTSQQLSFGEEAGELRGVDISSIYSDNLKKSLQNDKKEVLPLNVNDNRSIDESSKITDPSISEIAFIEFEVLQNLSVYNCLPNFDNNQEENVLKSVEKNVYNMTSTSNFSNEYVEIFKPSSDLAYVNNEERYAKVKMINTFILNNDDLTKTPDLNLTFVEKNLKTNFKIDIQSIATCVTTKEHIVDTENNYIYSHSTPLKNTEKLHLVNSKSTEDFNKHNSLEDKFCTFVINNNNNDNNYNNSDVIINVKNDKKENIIKQKSLDPYNGPQLNKLLSISEEKLFDGLKKLDLPKWYLRNRSKHRTNYLEHSKSLDCLSYQPGLSVSTEIDINDVNQNSDQAVEKFLNEQRSRRWETTIKDTTINRLSNSSVQLSKSDRSKFTSVVNCDKILENQNTERRTLPSERTRFARPAPFKPINIKSFDDVMQKTDRLSNQLNLSNDSMNSEGSCSENTDKNIVDTKQRLIENENSTETSNPNIECVKTKDINEKHIEDIIQTEINKKSDQKLKRSDSWKKRKPLKMNNKIGFDNIKTSVVDQTLEGNHPEIDSINHLKPSKHKHSNKSVSSSTTTTTSSLNYSDNNNQSFPSSKKSVKSINLAGSDDHDFNGNCSTGVLKRNDSWSRRKPLKFSEKTKPTSDEIFYKSNLKHYSECSV